MVICTLTLKLQKCVGLPIISQHISVLQNERLSSPSLKLDKMSKLRPFFLTASNAPTNTALIQQQHSKLRPFFLTASNAPTNTALIQQQHSKLRSTFERESGSGRVQCSCFQQLPQVYGVTYNQLRN